MNSNSLNDMNESWEKLVYKSCAFSSLGELIRMLIEILCQKGMLKFKVELSPRFLEYRSPIGSGSLQKYYW